MIAAVMAFVLATATTAVGQDGDVCARLEAQLDQFVSAVPTEDATSRFDDIVAEHRYRIGLLREELSHLDCSTGSVIVLGSRTRQVCKRMRADLEFEETQLQTALEQRQGDLSGDNSLAKQRILAALDANGCGASDGIIIRDTLGVEGDEELVVDPYKLYRTVCVRMCDGYYYPISFGTTPDQFGRDATQCTRTCPGADVDLFFHSVPDQESEEMVSVVGQTPYRNLPNAFAYRRSGSFGGTNCSCDEQPLSNGTIDAAPGSSRSVVIIDPDRKNTDANSARGNEDELAEEDKTPVREIDPERRIRVVGPEFLPDQSEAIDLQAPVPNATP
ncbi:MAG: DUF2865 domain-containing protein [Pseudomonadota bacterium]